MILFLDNYDSFTYNLVDYFKQLGQECYLVHNDVPLSELPEKNISSLVISPGPGVPKTSGYIYEYLDYYHNKIPVLGICLGHQAICEYFGAKLQHAIKPMHGKISRIHRQDDMIFENIPEYFNVVRYHSLVGDVSVKDLKTIAYTEEREVMAVRHLQLPIWGIQYHPEAALTEFGIRLLENWLKATDQLN